MFSHGSRRQLSQREIAPNPETNPNPNWGGGAIFLGDHCLGTFPHDCSLHFLTIVATV